MDRTIHKIFPGNETIIPGRSPIFPGSDAIILGQFPLRIAAKSTKIEKIEQKIKFFAPAWGLVEHMFGREKAAGHATSHCEILQRVQRHSAAFSI